MQTISPARIVNVTSRKTPASDEAFHAERLTPDRARFPLREQRLQRTADHHLNNGGAVDGACRQGRDMRAVAQNRDVVGDPFEFLEAVGDQQHRGALISQSPHDGVQLLAFSRRQRRRRLVENEEPQIGGQRASDLHELQFGHRETRDQRARIDIDPEPRQGGASALAHRLAVDRAEDVHRRIAHRDVFGDVQMGEELGILIDGDHAGATRLDRRPEAHRLSREQELAGVRFENPRDDLDQRRLAGAVLADKRVDAPGRDVERDLGQRLR